MTSFSTSSTSTTGADSTSTICHSDQLQAAAGSRQQAWKQRVGRSTGVRVHTLPVDDFLCLALVSLALLPPRLPSRPTTHPSATTLNMAASGGT